MSRGASAIMTTKGSKAASKLKDLEKAEKAAAKAMDKATKAWAKAADRLEKAAAKAAGSAKGSEPAPTAPIVTLTADAPKVDVSSGDASA